MIAYNTCKRLCEFSDIDGIAVCKNCHRLYKKEERTQSNGYQQIKHDICSQCNWSNSTTIEYYNNIMLTEEVDDLNGRPILLEKVVDYSYDQYKSSECEICNHVEGCVGECIGNCKNCLKEIHFPKFYPNGKKEYDCQRLLDFYVCDYSYKYMSEMLYLIRKSQVIKDLEYYHIISIGCGACPDLMAFEIYCHENRFQKEISYIGVDVNIKWKSIHDIINQYRTDTIKRTQFFYYDAVEESERLGVSDANVIVLQYIISYLYNTIQIDKINQFYKDLIDMIVRRKKQGKPLVILINDVNSNARGRDLFGNLVYQLEQARFSGTCNAYYFDYNIKNRYQMYGEKQETSELVYEIPNKLNVFNPWKNCSSAQLLIEVK